MGYSSMTFLKFDIRIQGEFNEKRQKNVSDKVWLSW